MLMYLKTLTYKPKDIYNFVWIYETFNVLFVSKFLIPGRHIQEKKV